MGQRPTSASAAGRRARRGPFAVLGLSLFVIVLAVPGLATLSACGGSSTTAAGSSSAPGGIVAASPSATAPLAITPVRLVGSDSVAATRKVIDAFGSGVAAQSGAQLAPLYADAVVYDDFVFNLHLEGKASVLKELRRSLGEASGARVLAGYAGSGWGVIEHRWDFSDNYGVSIQPITVLEIREQQIVGEAWYYQDPANVSDGRPLAPKPLDSAPGPADTPAAAQGVALEYAAALQVEDAGAVAALSAPKVAFTDTASSTVGSSPSEVQTHYASIFEA